MTILAITPVITNGDASEKANDAYRVSVIVSDRVGDGCPDRAGGGVGG